MKNKIYLIITLLLSAQLLIGQAPVQLPYNYGLDVCTQDAKIEGKLNLDNNYKSVLIGNGAGYFETINGDKKNLMIGFNAGGGNIYGIENVMVGQQAGESGEYEKNVFIGDAAAFNMSGGRERNVAIGFTAGLEANSIESVIIGTFAGRLSGNYNIYIGDLSGQNNEGTSNVYLGAQTGSMQIGVFDDNTFLGGLAGHKSSKGSNTFLGYSAGSSASSTGGNVAIGDSIGAMSIGHNNVIVGSRAGLQPGSANVFLGNQAGAQVLSNNKLYIDNTDTNTPLFWGDFSIDTLCINGGLNVVGDLCTSMGMAGCSDLRFKKNITPIHSALYNISKVKAVTHEWRHDVFPERRWKKGIEYGVIAQDIEKVFPHLVNADDQGYKYVDYTKLTPILIAAVSEQQEVIDEHQEQILYLQKSLASLNAMKERVDSLKRQLVDNNVD